MKNLIILLPLLLIATISTAQVKFGLRGGLSSTDLKPETFVIKDQADVDAFTLSTGEADYGYHLGIFLQAGGKKILYPT